MLVPIPERISVKYTRRDKAGKRISQTVGIPYSHEFTIDENIELLLGFVRSFHDVVSVGSVFLKY